MSSFGYSGTIAHALLHRRFFCLHAELPLPPLLYRRRAFPWRELDSPEPAASTSLYATCWARLPPDCVLPSGPRLLLLAPASTRLSVARAAPPCQVVAALLDCADSAAPSMHGAWLVFSLAQQLARQLKASRFIVFTCGAQSFEPAHGGVWGFARVLRLEHPALRMQSVDVLRGAIVAMAPALLGPSEEAEVLWRDGLRHAARLRACPSTSRRDGALAAGVYTITGGLGGLGLRAATLLLEGGATRVLLASRNGRVARYGQGLTARLRALGAVAQVEGLQRREGRQLRRPRHSTDIPSQLQNVAFRGQRESRLKQDRESQARQLLEARVQLELGRVWGVVPVRARDDRSRSPAGVA